MDENRTEWLPRTLTDEDVRARGDDLARVLGEIDREEAEKSAAAKAASGRIKRLAGESISRDTTFRVLIYHMHATTRPETSDLPLIRRRQDFRALLAEPIG